MALIIGDSQVKYLNQYLWDGITCIPKPGYKVQDLVPIIEEVGPYFNKVVLHCGTNNVLSEDAETIVDHILNFAETLKRVNSYATLMVSGILPRKMNGYRCETSGQRVAGMNAKSACVNDMLRQCLPNMEVMFIELWDFFLQPGMISFDGLHITAQGCKLLCRSYGKFCKSKVPIKLSVPTEQNVAVVSRITTISSKQQGVAASLPSNEDFPSLEESCTQKRFVLSQVPKVKKLPAFQRMSQRLKVLPSQFTSISCVPCVVQNSFAPVNPVVPSAVESLKSNFQVPVCTPSSGQSSSQAKVSGPLHNVSSAPHSPLPYFQHSASKRFFRPVLPCIESFVHENKFNVLNSVTENEDASMFESSFGGKKCSKKMKDCRFKNSVNPRKVRSRLVGGGATSLSEGVSFSSYKEFTEVYEQWLEEGHHPMRVNHSVRSPGGGDNIPYVQVKYVCKHFGKPRIRGNDVRPNQKYNAKGCPVHVKIIYNNKLKCYVVRSMIDCHNHETGPDVIMHYPDQRLLDKGEQEVIAPIKYNMGTKELRQFIGDESGKMLQSKDVHNLRQRAKENIVDGRSQAALLVDELTKLQEEIGCSVHIETDENNELLFLVMQTSFMKNLASKYSDVLMIDGTYKVNAEGYPLYCVLCEDGKGHGKPISYVFVRNETEVVLSKAFVKVLDLNPNMLNCKVMIMDKDRVEMNIVSKMLPQCKIILCSFHVLKAFKEKVASLDCTREKKAQVAACLKQLLYSSTEDSYNTNFQVLLNVAPSEFMQYYIINWDKCKELWVFAFRRKELTLGNNTNNRLESHNQKLKQYLKSSMHLPEAVKALCDFIRVLEVNFSQEAFKEMKTHINKNFSDNIHLQISSHCTVEATKLICRQLEKSKQEMIYANGNVSFNGFSYCIGNNFTVCSCTFFSQYSLPCAHLLFARRACGMCVFSEDTVSSRWKKDTFVGSLPSSQSEMSVSTYVVEKTLLRKPLSEREKYNLALSHLKPIASFIATLGVKQFNDCINKTNEFFGQLLQDFRSSSMHLPEHNSVVTDGSIGSPQHVSVNSLASSFCENNNFSCPADASLLHDELGEFLKFTGSSVPSEESNFCENVSSASTLPLTVSSSFSVNDKTKFQYVDCLPESRYDSVLSEPNLCENVLQESFSSSLIADPNGYGNEPQSFDSLESQFTGKNLSSIRNQLIIPNVVKRRGRPKGSRTPFQIFPHTSRKRKLVTIPEVEDVDDPRQEACIKEDLKRSRTPQIFQHYSRKCELATIPEVKDVDDPPPEACIPENPVTCKYIQSSLKILSSREWLDDTVVACAQKLLKQQYPFVNSLQDTLLGTVLQFQNADQPWVQVIYCNKHWVTISAIECPEGYVDVFDSKFYSKNRSVVELITVQAAELMKFRGRKITLHYQVPQEHKGSDDCGLFAIARAVALCNGFSMHGRAFVQAQMRSHLLKCLQEGSIEPFPTVPVRQKTFSTEIKCNIFCVCRLPHSRSTNFKTLNAMVQCDSCKEWYHLSCLNKVIDVDEKYMCNLCDL
ncbi:uncharacterized protein LOC134527287 [Bacillus rossius redtenbacheri]|uniref:uncharacterized protein LOC134527287 n=1 Tax=Bacillus rossius redtenbacheri TaxID=93214 RepID=UPI002FDE3640